MHEAKPSMVYSNTSGRKEENAMKRIQREVTAKNEMENNRTNCSFSMRITQMIQPYNSRSKLVFSGPERTRMTTNGISKSEKKYIISLIIIFITKATRNFAALSDLSVRMKDKASTLKIPRAN